MDDLTSTLESLRGGITAEEGAFLRDLAHEVEAGCIVELGSFRGKSAVALAAGLPSRGGHVPTVHCVEPHAPFEGVYGGQFGPADRAAYYRTMLDTGVAEQVGLLNAGSAVAATGWQRPVGLLFVDGDHTLAGVARDLGHWERHVVLGGLVVFDDARDPEIGPYQVVEQLLASGRYAHVGGVGKVVALRKVVPVPPLGTTTHLGHRRILLVTHALTRNGGLLRFERTAQHWWRQGHEVAWLRLAEEGNVADEFPSTLPVLGAQAAAGMQWDLTMLPGAGFPDATFDRLPTFDDPRYGTRVQHVLNDRSRTPAFVRANDAFQPHVVVFNTRVWEPGTYTRMRAERFHVLEGAVDTRRFAPAATRPGRHATARRVVGGLAGKGGTSFVAALRQLPDHVHGRLFGNVPAGLAEVAGDLLDAGRLELVGPLDDAELPDFHRGLDVVVALEEAAGWCNLAAEAMACGVPVVTTRPGTAAFAVDGDTALLLDDLDPAAVAGAVRRLLDDDELAARLRTRGRAAMLEHDWREYADDLLSLTWRHGDEHYTHLPELGLYGKWPVEERLQGLGPALARVAGRSVLDLGCAEGVFALACLENGATSVHGFEQQPFRVLAARALCSARPARFEVGDLGSWDAFTTTHADVLDEGYDVVAHLGLHHHLPAATRLATLRGALARARELFLFRTPPDVAAHDGCAEVIAAAGFEAVTDGHPERPDHLGAVAVYRRRAAVTGAPPAPTAVAAVAARPADRELHFVSFPKSGRSWIRYALTELGLADRIHFHHDGFEYNDASRPPLDFSVDRRLERYGRADGVVLLERDPRDVMVSLHHQVTGRFRDIFGYEGDLSAFLRDDYFGAHNLAGFRRTWAATAAGLGVTTVTYEQCHHDMAQVLGRVCATYGFPVAQDELVRAAEAAQFDRMRRVERDGTFDAPWLRLRNDSPKVRQGRVGGHREVLGAPDQAYLDALFGTSPTAAHRAA